MLLFVVLFHSGLFCVIYLAKRWIFTARYLTEKTLIDYIGPYIWINWLSGTSLKSMNVLLVFVSMALKECLTKSLQYIPEIPVQPQIRPRKVLLLGSGGLSIGQAGEFDYSGSQVQWNTVLFINLVTLHKYICLSNRLVLIMEELEGLLFIEL